MTPCPPGGNGFPESYFTIKCLGSQGRVLDVRGGDSKDGTEIILYVDHADHKVRKNAQNQLFFVDKHGTLRSKASGHAVGYDPKGQRLVLRHTQGPHSDLPIFSYCAQTREILVQLPTKEEKPYFIAAPKEKHFIPPVIGALAFFGVSPGFSEPEKLTKDGKPRKPLIDEEDFEASDSDDKMRQVHMVPKDDERAERVGDRRYWEVKVVPESWLEWFHS